MSPRADGLDGVEDVAHVARLRKVAGGARLERCTQEARLLEATQHQHAGSPAAAELFDQVEAARPAADPDVAHHDVRRGPLHQVDRTLDVCRATDDLDPGPGVGGLDERGKDRG